MFFYPWYIDMKTASWPAYFFIRRNFLSIPGSGIFA